jgi:predicted ATP-dependent serine protease
MGPRLKEAKKLGFDRATIPLSGEAGSEGLGLKLERIGHVKDLAKGLVPCD